MIIGASKVARDITRQKESEQVLRDSEERLRLANVQLEQWVVERTASLRAMASQLTRTEQRERKRLAQVLHDEVQQLLAAIKMQATLSLRQSARAGAIYQVMKLADEAILACRVVTVNLSPPVLRDADMTGAMQWLARHMGEQHGLQVKVLAEEPAPPLSEELRSLLFEVTRELLFNVVKHAKVDRAVVRLWQSEGQVRVEVADEGIGCAPDLLLQPQHTSFGLFSIQERLLGLGGTLEVIPGEKRGSRFRINLPRAGEADLSADAENVAKPGVGEGDTPGHDRLRVLLADDHQILRQGLAELLAAQPGTQVVGEASNGAEAIIMARQLKPDVVVMDITMPGMGGVEATRLLHLEMPHLRVIGLSMHEEDDMATAMRNAGASAFINKGGPIENLLAALRS